MLDVPSVPNYKQNKDKHKYISYKTVELLLSLCAKSKGIQINGGLIT